jgi:hypothetical protein
MKLAVISLLAAGLIGIQPAQSETLVSGEIETTTWTAAGSPYRVTDTLYVQTGHSLTIDPGVDILTEGNAQIRVSGRLMAYGTESDSIRFMDAVNGGPRWDGFVFDGGDSSHLEYVRVGMVSRRVAADGEIGGAILVKGNGTRLAMVHSVLRLNSVVIENPSPCEGSPVTGRGGAILILDSCSVRLDHCLIERNSAYHLYEKDDSNSSIWTCPVPEPFTIGRGVEALGPTGTLSITRTVFVDNDGVRYLDKLAIRSEKKTSLVNCTFLQSVELLGDSTHEVTNTIMWDGSIHGDNVDIRYSIVSGDVVPPGEGNFNDDPRFVDERGEDFHLRLTSPAIDGGDPTMTDPDGSRIDIGALPPMSIPSTSTVVSGVIEGDRTWSLANAPYYVVGTAYVESGHTLTIEPGVDVLFASDTQLRVNGRLNAQGTESDSIRFISASLVDRWDGLVFDGGDSSKMSYVRVSGVEKLVGSDGENGGGILVQGQGSSIGMSHSVISDNIVFAQNEKPCAVIPETGHGGGLLALDGSRATLEDCIVRSNEATHKWTDPAPRPATHDCPEPSIPGGGGIQSLGPTGSITLRRTLVHGNRSSIDWASGVRLASKALIENCTVLQNIFVTGDEVQRIVNTIAYGISSTNLNVDVSYSLFIYNEYPLPIGTGILFVDPLFVGGTPRDYRLRLASPAIDTGDPNMFDSDGTRSDIGAFAPVPLLGTPVSGSIEENTTWTTANGPYHVIDTVRVNVGQTLTIERGVDVLLDDDAQIRVSGRMMARGTALDSIRFLPADVLHRWDGIVFEGGDSSRLEFVRISGAVKAMISNNSENGGGVLVKDDSTRLIMKNSVISDNVALGQRNIICRGITGLGGGMLILDSTNVTLEDCVVRNNAATYASGSFLATRSSKIDCGEPQEWVGGGIYASGVTGNFTARRTLFVGNYALFGSAIRSTRQTSLINCTITGVVLLGSVWGTEIPEQVINTIIWGDLLSGESIDLRYSIVGWVGIRPGPGNLKVDPLFVDLENGDYRLQKGSPAIDAGAPTMFDADGTRSDMGAFAYGQAPVAVTEALLPSAITLSAAPNPFNPSTTIRYSLLKPGEVQLRLYNTAGQLVRTLVDEPRGAGTHSIQWNGEDTSGRVLSSGVYIIRLTTSSEIITRKITLLK